MRHSFSIALLLVGVLFARASLAGKENPFSLPEGALARLGKGDISFNDRAVAYSPDGARLAVASSIGIWLYNAHTGAEVALFAGHTRYVLAVSFSPDGLTLASGSGDGTILLWDMSPYVTPWIPDSDFDGDGIVSFTDFLQFAAQFGLSQSDEDYDARYDLDGDGTIGFGDFLIFANAFGR